MALFRTLILSISNKTKLEKIRQITNDLLKKINDQQNNLDGDGNDNGNQRNNLKHIKRQIEEISKICE